MSESRIQPALTPAIVGTISGQELQFATQSCKPDSFSLHRDQAIESSALAFPPTAILPPPGPATAVLAFGALKS